MKDFSINVKLPSGKFTRVPELSNKTYFKLIKFCENSDYEGLNSFVETNIISDTSLDIIDRFYLIIFYRMVFVRENLTFTTKDQQTLDYSLSIILERIESCYNDFSKDITFNDIKLHVGLPTTLYFSTIDELYTTVIKQVTLFDSTIDFTNCTREEQDDILSRLPPSIFFKIREYVTDVSESLQDFIIIEENKLFDIEQYKLNILSNGIMSFICSLFSGSLPGFYTLMYGFINRIGADSELFYSLSPVEAQVILNIHNKEVEKQNEELKNQSQ
jgi:hypothetical protein